MRVIIVILVLAVAGYFAYTLFFAPVSEEEQAVKDLEKQFNVASRAFLGAGRMAGATGLDTTSEARDAVSKIKSTRRKLRKLMKSLNGDKAIERAEALEARMHDFYIKNEIVDN